MEYLTGRTCGSKDWGSRNEININNTKLKVMCNIRKESSREL